MSSVHYKGRRPRMFDHNQIRYSKTMSYNTMQTDELATMLYSTQRKFDKAVHQMARIDQRVADAKVRLARIARGSTYWQLSAQQVATLQGVRRMYMKYAQKQVGILERCSHRLAELAAIEGAGCA